MSYCDKCGTKFSDKNTYCGACGNKVGNNFPQRESNEREKCDFQGETLGNKRKEKTNLIMSSFKSPVSTTKKLVNDLDKTKTIIISIIAAVLYALIPVIWVNRIINSATGSFHSAFVSFNRGAASTFDSDLNKAVAKKLFSMFFTCIIIALIYFAVTFLVIRFALMINNKKLDLSKLWKINILSVFPIIICFFIGTLIFDDSIIKVFLIAFGGIMSLIYMYACIEEFIGLSEMGRALIVIAWKIIGLRTSIWLVYGAIERVARI